MKVKKWEIALVVCVCIIVAGGFLFAKSLEKPQQKADMPQDGVLDVVIGKRNEPELTVLDAEAISQAAIDYSLLEDVETYSKEVDYTEIADEIKRLIESDAEGFLLSDISELSVSTYNMPIICLSTNSVSAVYEFLFVGETPVGALMFYEHEREIVYSISLYTADSVGYFFDFLENDKEGTFVILSDERNFYFLGDDNKLYNPSTGNEKRDIPVRGDCYHCFEENAFVSYERVMENRKAIGGNGV